MNPKKGATVRFRLASQSVRPGNRKETSNGVFPFEFLLEACMLDESRKAPVTRKVQKIFDQTLKYEMNNMTRHGFSLSAKCSASGPFATSKRLLEKSFSGPQKERLPLPTSACAGGQNEKNFQLTRNWTTSRIASKICGHFQIFAPGIMVTRMPHFCKMSIKTSKICQKPQVC